MQKAEATIRQTALDEQYASAISIAFLKYDAEIERAARNKFGDEITDASDSIEPFGFGLTIDPQNPYPEILTLPHQQLLTSALEPIRDWLATMNETLPMSDEEAIDAGVLVLSNGGDDDVSEVAYRDQIAKQNAAAAEVRDRFFRFLLKEYRRVFGDDDPRVAETLNLLAACLIDLGDTEEAEARLRESIALANEYDKSVARKLLAVAAAKRRSR